MFVQDNNKYMTNEIFNEQGQLIYILPKNKLSRKSILDLMSKGAKLIYNFGVYNYARLEYDGRVISSNLNKGSVFSIRFNTPKVKKVDTIDGEMIYAIVNN